LIITGDIENFEGFYPVVLVESALDYEAFPDFILKCGDLDIM
jgi:hypothetical protein